MKAGLKWALALVALGLVGAGTTQWLGKRKAAQALAAPTTTQAVDRAELAPSDVVAVTDTDLSQELPISGSLKAISSAVVKARVAGELQGLQVREGDSVRAGQIVARIDPTEYQARLRQAQDQAEATRAQVEIAQRQYQNNQSLVDQGFISRTALDTSLSSLRAAQSTHQAALAAVDVARKTLDDTVMKAPITGQVALRAAQPGERLGVDARVLELVDPTRLELEASVAMSDAVRVQVGQVARLRIDGLETPLLAKVSRINPSTQASTRSVVMYLALAPSPALPQLRQGLFAQGQLAIGRHQTLALPISTIRTDKPAPYVQAISQGKVRHLPVQPGIRGDIKGEAWAAVTGLSAGVQVTRASVGALRDGTEVRFTTPPVAAASAPVSTEAR